MHPEDQGTLVKGVNKGDGNTTMALSLALNETETKAASRERRQVLFDITCEEGSSQENAWDVALIYSVLEHKLDTYSNSQQAMVEAVFTPEPTNPWHWSVIFESIQTREHYNNRDTDFVRTIKGREVNYHLRTVRAPQHLLVVVLSNPVIANKELAWHFRNLVTVKGMQKQMHSFNPIIDSGLRKTFLLLHEGVKARDLPSFITTSDDITGKLFFRGEFLLQ